LVFHRPENVRYETVADPRIEDPRDALVRISRTSIVGSDLHVYGGFVPQLEPTILGQEFVGVVEEIGRDVGRLERGDRIAVPFAVACGRCWYCEHALTTQCEVSNAAHFGADGSTLIENGGGVFGYSSYYGGYPGGHAEFVRVPFADVGPRRIPDELTDDAALQLGSTLLTAHAAVSRGEVQAGDTVAVFGAGPVGLLTAKCAWLAGAGRVIAVDREPARLALAERAARSEALNLDTEDIPRVIREMTHGRGVDVAIDATGLEAHRSLLEKVSNVVSQQAGTLSAFKLAASAVRRGGRLSVIGAYLEDYDGFPLGQLADKALTVRFAQTTPHASLDALLEPLRSGRLVADDIITHRLALADGSDAFKLYRDKLDGCVKVVLTP
jgi:threonine dehydrogenase-like Zn-dependent dehydrogenase